MKINNMDSIDYHHGKNHNLQTHHTYIDKKKGHEIDLLPCL